MVTMNVLEITLYVKKGEYEDYLVDYHSLPEPDRQKFIDDLNDREEYDRIRRKISESMDTDDLYVSETYRFLTDITADEFEMINDCGDSDCIEQGYHDSACQWSEYNFELELAHNLDDSGFYNAIWWKLCENNVTNGTNVTKMPDWLSKMLRERLEENIH